MPIEAGLLPVLGERGSNFLTMKDMKIMKKSRESIISALLRVLHALHGKVSMI
jgi:hypothetical protein